MILFCFEHGRGMGPLRENDAWRVLITGDPKNNVIVWRGYNDTITQCTLDMEAIWDIRELIRSQEKLFSIGQLEENIPPALDIPCYDFFFNGGDGKQAFFTGYLFGYRRHNDYPNTDLVIKTVAEIQKILQNNGLDIVMWDGWFAASDDA